MDWAGGCFFDAIGKRTIPGGTGHPTGRTTVKRGFGFDDLCSAVVCELWRSKTVVASPAIFHMYVWTLGVISLPLGTMVGELPTAKDAQENQKTNTNRFNYYAKLQLHFGILPAPVLGSRRESPTQTSSR